MAEYQDYVDKTQAEYSNPSVDRLNTGKYSISTTTYPSDLGSEDLKHFVLFNINVRGKSKADPKSKRLFEVKRDPNSASLSLDQIATATTVGASVAAGIAAGVAVTSLVSNAKKAITKTGATAVTTRVQAAAKTAAPKVIGTVAGLGAAAATAAAVSFNDILKKDTLYRISDAIALHVDAPPSVKYNMNYANKDLGTLMGVFSGSAADMGKAMSSIGEMGAGLGATLAKLPGAFGGGDLAAGLSKSSGAALNPFREVVFEFVDFRTFGFKYKFLPKSKKESDSVHNIISMFKQHMHPQLSEGKLFFIYPSEFQITYYFDTGPNPYVHKFRPCVLESMDVTYGGDQLSSFKDGTPTEINMSLMFRETEILTRQMVKDGY